MAREAALQVLFAADLSGEVNPESVEASFEEVAREFSLPGRARQWAQELARGVAENLKQIDENIGRASTNWQVHRIATVYRNILRVAATTSSTASSKVGWLAREGARYPLTLRMNC